MSNYPDDVTGAEPYFWIGDEQPQPEDDEAEYITIESERQHAARAQP